MYQVIKYRLTSEGTIPTFVENGGYFSVQDNLYPPPQQRFIVGISVQNPVGDFEVVADEQQLMALVGCTEIQARTLFSMCACYNDGTYPISNSQQPTPSELDRVQNAKQTATAFLTAKIGVVNPDLKYSLTYFSQETQTDIADLFDNGVYIVKVSNNVVTEWYKYYVFVDGIEYFGVSLNLETSTVEDKYLESPQGLVKFSSNPSDPPSVVIYGNWYSVPNENKARLSNFPYKAAVQKWINRPYGFILEYALPNANA